MQDAGSRGWEGGWDYRSWAGKAISVARFRPKPPNAEPPMTYSIVREYLRGKAPP